MKKPHWNSSRWLIPWVALSALVTIPVPADALLYTVEGNAPQPAANYQQWPGLVDAVNQKTRQGLLWCNGFESLTYTGDTDALNAMLKQYAKVECPNHTVIFRPGPLQKKYDWELHFSQGITQAFIEKNEMQSVRDVDPTLVIYVNDKLKLDSLVIPEGLQAKQLSDLRAQYRIAQQTGNERTQKEAASFLKSLDEDPVRKSLGQTRYEEQLRQISGFVKRITD